MKLTTLGRSRPPRLGGARANLVLALLLATACGGPDDVGRTTGGPLRDATPRRGGADPARAEGSSGGATAPRERPPGRPFAATPISEVMEALADLAVTAALGRPTSGCPVPTRQPWSDPATVEWSPSVTPRPRELAVLGVGLEVELVFKVGEPPASEDRAATWGSVRVTLALSRNGLRLVALRPRRVSAALEGGRPPPGMEGLTAVGAQVLTHLRGGDLSSLELDDDDRAIIDDDAVWTQVMADRPRAVHVRELSRALADLPDEPLAYRLDSVAVLVRDEQDRLLSLSLNLDPHDGSFALDLAPLVSVQQLWPRSRGGQRLPL